MSIAYIDTSVIVAIALGESGAAGVQRRLRRFTRLCAAALLEAEFRATLLREGIKGDGAEVIEGIHFIHPNCRLSAEINLILQHGYLRGADLWHVATALFFATKPALLPFATLDETQAQVAAAVGFPLIV